MELARRYGKMRCRATVDSIDGRARQKPAMLLAAQTLAEVAMRPWARSLTAAFLLSCFFPVGTSTLPAALPSVAAPSPADKTPAGDPKTNRSPAAELVAQALEAEVQADLPRHDALLAAARQADPDHEPAHWQSGQVRVENRWLTIDAAVDLAPRDERLTEYQALRAKYARDEEGLFILARWCQKNGFKDELRAHASQLFQHRRDDPEVLKMLGLTWHQGQLLSRAQLAARTEDERQANQAQRLWLPRLRELLERMSDPSTGTGTSALAELRAIRDPAAIASLESLAKNRHDLSLEMPAILGHVPGEKSTDALLRQALLSKWPDVRRTACEHLRNRPPHGYVPKLLSALSTPLEARLDVVREGDSLRVRESVSREGAEVKYEKSIDHEVSLITPNPFLADILGSVYAESFLSNQRTAKSLQGANRKIAEMNGAIYFVLEHTTNQKLPRDPEPWWGWWQDYNVLSSTQKTLVARNYKDRIDVPYVPPTPAVVPAVAFAPAYHGHHPAAPTAPAPQPPGTLVFSGLPAPPPGKHWDLPGQIACFARGTPVWSQAGLQAIEEILVGDHVLSQDPLTGELSYRVVLEATLGHQPMLAIDTDSDRIVATLGHVFWVSGRGWRMARQLKPGDRLHTAGGWTEILAIEKMPADETHNLVVADAHTFFVGAGKILVHDYSLMQPTTAQVPGQLER
jgi:hypothetical protein